MERLLRSCIMLLLWSGSLFFVYYLDTIVIKAVCLESHCSFVPTKPSRMTLSNLTPGSLFCSCSPGASISYIHGLCTSLHTWDALPCKGLHRCFLHVLSGTYIAVTSDPAPDPSRKLFFPLEFHNSKNVIFAYNIHIALIVLGNYIFI